jgi:threonine synthase
MSSVTYSSTRGDQKKLDFRTVVMQGLAHDRGLFVPDEIPTVSAEELAAWRDLSYPDLSVQIFRKFVKEDQVPLSVLKDIIHRSCAAFRHPNVTPVIQVNGHAVLVRLCGMLSQLCHYVLFLTTILALLLFRNCFMDRH